MKMRFVNSIQGVQVQKRKTFLGLQVISLVFTGLAFLVWAVVEKIKPEFFNYPFWCTTDNIFQSVLRFWPLFVWGAIMALIGYGGKLITKEDAEEIFLLDTATSVMAGLWEELGFRCVFILTAMVGIWLSNFFWKWTIIILVVVSVITLLASLTKEDIAIFLIGIIMMLIFGGLGFFLWNVEDPVYWVYERIVIPVTNFVTLGLCKDVLYNKSVSLVFIAGMISANSRFRDGHKYQGFKGMLNSWFIGMVLLVAMINHGLVVAMIVHALYDIEFAVMRYSFVKSR
jgi:hypothetical protein